MHVQWKTAASSNSNGEEFKPGSSDQVTIVLPHPVTIFLLVQSCSIVSL